MFSTSVRPSLGRLFQTWNPWRSRIASSQFHRRKRPFLCSEVAPLEDRTLLSLTSVFEIDGNTTDGADAGEDWSTLFPSGGGTAPRTTFVADASASDVSYYESAGAKDGNDISADGVTNQHWAPDTGDVSPDKNDITNAFAAAYLDPYDGHLLLYFGADKFDASGSNNIGFWFFQDDVTVDLDAGVFNGVHVNGDILLVTEFTQGGSVGTVKVYEWVDGTLQLIPTTTANAKAAFNAAALNEPGWPYVDKDGNTSYAANTFVEGGVDLTALGLAEGCFSSFLARTLSSGNSQNAQLKDFALGSFDLCGASGTGAAPPCAEPGEVIQFDVTLENTGIAPIYLDDMSDPTLGALIVNGVAVDSDVSNGSGTIIDPAGFILDPGEATTISVVVTVGNVNGITFVPTVVYNDQADLTGEPVPVENLEAQFVDVMNPGVTITKVADVKAATEGTLITYTYTITNTTDYDPSTEAIDGTGPDLILSTLVDDDPAIGSLFAAAALAGLDVLSAGESGSFEATRIVTEDDFDAGATLTNIVKVNYFPVFAHCPVPEAQDDAEVVLVDAAVAITPAQAANQVGNPHQLTVTVTVSGGVVADVGASIAASENGPGTLSDGSCSTGGGNSSEFCNDLTLESNATGLSVISATATIPIDVDGDGVADITLVRMTDGSTTVDGLQNSDPTLKRWVDARLTLSPEAAANQIDSEHVITALLEFDYGDGAGWVPAPDGETILLAIVDGPGELSDDSCVTDGGDGNCTVILTSAVTGLTTIDADWSGSITTAEGIATAETDADDVVKRWVDAQLILTPGEAVNRVGSEHIITAELNFDYGDGEGFVDAPAGEIISFTIVDGPGGLSDVTCTTGPNGTCQVTLTSSETGLTTIDGDWAGSIGTAEGSAAASTDADDVTKLWVDAYIVISPDGVNGITDPHTFTVTVYVDDGDGTFDPFEGADVTVTLANSGGAVADPAGPAEGTTDGDGEFDVTFTSATTGTVTGHAEASLTVAGLALTIETDDIGNNSDDAVKTFIAGTLRWLKVDGDLELLGGATFLVTGPAYPSGVSVLDNSALDVDKDNGEFQMDGLVLGTYTIHETIAPFDYDLDPDTESVLLTLDNPSNADGGQDDDVPEFVNTRQVEGRMTGGGSVFLPGGNTSPGAGIRVTHGFQLHCADEPTTINNRLEINWANSTTSKSNNHFHLLTLVTVGCFDDPALDEQQPDADIDTLFGTGIGRFTGKVGLLSYKNVTAWVDFTFTDDGEPGVDDHATYRIWIDVGDSLGSAGYGVFDANDTLILTTDGSGDIDPDPDPLPLMYGNHQAHHEIASLSGTAATLQSNINKTHTSLESTNLGSTGIKKYTDQLLNYDNQLTALLNGNALTAAALGSGLGGTISARELHAAIAEAFAFWQANGADAEHFGIGQLNIELADLPDNLLGLASTSHNQIWIDRDAAGWGWSVGNTPGRLNLTAVIAHELGHAFELHHSDTGVMAATLAATAAHTDGAALASTTVTNVITTQENRFSIPAAQPQWLTLGLVTAPTNPATPVSRLDATPLAVQLVSARVSPTLDRHDLPVPVDDDDRVTLLNVVFDPVNLDATIFGETVSSPVKVAAPNDPNDLGLLPLSEADLISLANELDEVAAPQTEGASVRSVFGFETLLAMLGLAGWWGGHRLHKYERRGFWQWLFGRTKLARKGPQN